MEILCRYSYKLIYGLYHFFLMTFCFGCWSSILCLFDCFFLQKIFNITIFFFQTLLALM